MKTYQFVVIAGLLVANVYATVRTNNDLVYELKDVQAELDFANQTLTHIRLLPKEVFISRKTGTDAMRHQKRILQKRTE